MIKLISKQFQSQHLYPYIQSLYNVRLQTFFKKKTQENVEKDLAELSEDLQKARKFKQQIEDSGKLNQIEDSVVEQESYTSDKLKELIQKRQNELEEISKEENIPQDAKLVSIILTLPVFMGSVALNYICFQGLYQEDLNQLVTFYAKYVISHVSFLSGIHWGFAMSMHENQLDSINSTPEVRKHFTMASFPLFVAFYCLNNLCYSQDVTELIKLSSIGTLIGLHIYNLGMDRTVLNMKQCPKWFWKLKLYISIVSILSLSGFGYLYLNYNQQINKSFSNFFRQNIPDQQMLLESSLKLSDIQKKN